MEEEHIKEPSHNNPEEATNYVKALDNLLKKFVSDIRGFNPYARQDVYKNFHFIPASFKIRQRIFHQNGHRSCA